MDTTGKQGLGQSRGQVSAQAQTSPGAPAKTEPGAGLKKAELDMLHLTEGLLAQESPKKAGAMLVNRLAEVAYSDRVVLVEIGHRSTLLNVSGGGVVDQDSHFSDAINVLNRRLGDQRKALVVPVENEEGEDQLRKVQVAMRGTQVLWLPLPFTSQASEGDIKYALWMERWRGRAWTDGEVALLNRGALLFGQGLRPRGGGLRKALPTSVILLAVLAVFVGVMMISTQSSTTAPARVVPADPTYVFAPLEGVLKDLEVKPGQQVRQGDVLFRYDADLLDRSIDESVRAVAVARAELERLEGAGFRDAEARAKLPVQKLEVERAEAESAFYMDQRARADVKAVTDGVVVLDDPDELVGKPLQQGEHVFSIADPGNTRLRLMVPASDAGLVKVGAEIEIHLDRDPLNSVFAKVTRVGYEIVVSEDDIPSIVIDAQWQPDSVGKIAPGQRGSAKVFSEPKPLWKQIFRKPLISFRQITGL